MLVILTEEQMISPTQVCRSCLLADKNGQPRWRYGKLGCGHAVRKLGENQPDQYECEMGFRIAKVD